MNELVQAYHLIFDVKDAQTPGSDAFVHAFEALQALKVVFADLGIEAPVRFDAQRVSA